MAKSINKYIAMITGVPGFPQPVLANPSREELE